MMTLVLSAPINAQQLNFTLYDIQKNPIENMVIYLEPVNDLALPKTNKSITIGQLNKSFAPYVSIIQVGNTVNFKNQDDITHHIYSPVGDNKFEFKIRSGQTHSKADFNNAGEIAMGCNIHDWMSGYLLILETPYFAKSDAQGQLTINVAQAEKYRVTVWHPNLETDNNREMYLMDTRETSTMSITLTAPISDLPEQKSEDDFDFLSDY